MIYADKVENVLNLVSMQIKSKEVKIMTYLSPDCTVIIGQLPTSSCTAPAAATASDCS